jgi:hypothetical protein
VKKLKKKKIFCRPTDPNFLAYVTGNIELFLRLTIGEETAVVDGPFSSSGCTGD